MLARRNGEQTRSINTLRERDRQIAGESAAVIGRKAGAGTGMPTITGGRDSDSSRDVVQENPPETQRRPPAGRTPLDRAHAPPTRAHAGRRIHAAMLARRNGEQTRSINTLSERDRQIAGESAAVIGRKAGAGTGMPTDTGHRDVVQENPPETQRRPVSYTHLTLPTIYSV